MGRFKEGDRVEIIGNEYHSSNDIGDIGVIEEICTKDQAAKVKVDGVDRIGTWSLLYDLKLREDLVTNAPPKASETQIAGNHYSKLKIQPMRYALENELNYGQANAVKYITRYKDKNGIEDLKKAIHCIELLIEFEESVDKE